ncbi:hypothetical protein RCO48_13495 [Peribacillus frigoritolerans]|nr:hypothetical protein [Peribacillus frigoritolerans]
MTEDEVKLWEEKSEERNVKKRFDLKKPPDYNEVIPIHFGGWNHWKKTI